MSPTMKHYCSSWYERKAV